MPPTQRVTASVAILSKGPPHAGQAVGNSIARVTASVGITRTICGITSPARRTMTVSPIRTPKRIISSALWSVALVTVTPPTKSAFKLATGVIEPVRPTWKVTSSKVVMSSSGGYLYALAQRGAREMKPNFFCFSTSLTLITTPSMPNFKLSRFSPRRVM